MIACFLPALVVYAVQGEAGVGLTFAVLVVTGFLAALIYTFVKDGLEGGASLGKRAVGLMVVHLPSNRPCSGGRSALRTLIWNVTNFVPLVGWLIEPVTAMASADRRRLGDRLGDQRLQPLVRGRVAVVVEAVQLQCLHQVVHVRAGGRHLRVLRALEHVGHDQRREHADDHDHDHQLDEREAGLHDAAQGCLSLLHG